MLHPSLKTPERMAQLQTAWRECPDLRLSPVLNEDAAATLLKALEQTPFGLKAPPPCDFNYQYWEHVFVPSETTSPVLAAFGRWLHTDFAAWVSAISGRVVGPPHDHKVLCTLFNKGCYLDAHNDIDGARQITHVFGLTKQPWTPEMGGALEIYRTRPTGVDVVERRTPSWNTLDLFDVTYAAPLHAVTMVRAHAHRRAIPGWLYLPQATAEM